MRKVIKVNLENKKSIQNAEKQKTKLENQGYSMRNFEIGFNLASFEYVK